MTGSRASQSLVAAGADVTVLGVVDDGISEVNLERLAARGVPFLGTRAAWLGTDPGPVGYVLGIGSPAVRRRLVAELDAAGLRAFTAIHPSATFGAQVVFVSPRV